MAEYAVRFAREEDAAAIRAVYEPYVRTTAISFEWEVPTVDEMARRMTRTLERYPYLVLEVEGTVVGYAYAGPFHERAAYGWSAETSIYIECTHRRAGMGGALYRELESVLAHMGVLNLNACIAYAEQEDAFLTHDSVTFHTRMGFSWVGRFHSCGYKFGRWYDMVWMEKMLARHPEVPGSLLPIAEVRAWYETGRKR